MSKKQVRMWRFDPPLGEYVTEADLMTREIVKARFPNARGRGKSKFASIIVQECLRRSLAEVVGEIKDAETIADVSWLFA